MANDTVVPEVGCKYLTRQGDTVVVTKHNPTALNFPFSGDHSRVGSLVFTRTGAYNTGGLDDGYDLVKKLNLTRKTVWVNLYKDDYTHTFASEDDARADRDTLDTQEVTFEFQS